MNRPWHAVLAVVGLVALVGQLVLVVRAGDGLLDFFSYFTIQSNVLVIAAAAAIALGRPGRGTAWRLLRLAGLVGITVTGLVYATVIGPTVSFEGITWWYDKVFHYVVPLMAVVGHVALRPRTTFRRSDVVVLVWPVAYLGYSLLRGAYGNPSFAGPEGVSRYPYDFLDVDRHGGTYVAVAALGVTAVMFVVAWLYVRLSGPVPAPVRGGSAAG